MVLLWPEYAHIFSGIFALVVITTLSFEKICMESRYMWLTERLTKQEFEKQKMSIEYHTLLHYSRDVKRFSEKNEKFK